ncbi:MAG: helix-turn-helix domain-containing protein [Microcoleaceae cyanobacterium]
MSKYYRSFKTKLDLNNQQRTIMTKQAGTTRDAWNWSLAMYLFALQNQQKSPTDNNLHKRLVRQVKYVYSWYYEFSKSPPQYPPQEILSIERYRSSF